MEKKIVYVDRDLEEIIPPFLKNREEDILRLNKALLESDFSTIKFLGHNMKGSGSGYGFHEVSRLGEALEKGAKEEDLILIKSLLIELKEYMEKVQIIYE